MLAIISLTVMLGLRRITEKAGVLDFVITVKELVTLWINALS